MSDSKHTIIGPTIYQQQAKSTQNKIKGKNTKCPNALRTGDSVGLSGCHAGYIPMVTRLM